MRAEGGTERESERGREKDGYFGMTGAINQGLLIEESVDGQASRA